MLFAVWISGQWMETYALETATKWYNNADTGAIHSHLGPEHAKWLLAKCIGRLSIFLADT